MFTGKDALVAEQHRAERLQRSLENYAISRQEEKQRVKSEAEEASSERSAQDAKAQPQIAARPAETT